MDALRAPLSPCREKRKDWELLNDNKAIWLRKASEVTEEEYQKFYKAISKVRPGGGVFRGIDVR